MEHIDSDLIDEADTYKRTRKNTWVKWGALAACLCLAAAGALRVNGLFGNREFTAENAAGKNEPGDTGLFIPAVELPDPAAGALYDMMGLVVYNGGIYTEAGMYLGADALKIDSLIGDYLGHATGALNEFSTKDEYAEEFASTVQGEVYEVIGYDTDFRICLRLELDPDINGGERLQIEFLDRLNGITLKTGEDLFETRLHLRDRIASIQWQSHEDWNDGGDSLQNAAFEEGLWEEFLAQVDSGSFVNTWNPELPVGSRIYDTEKQAHLILTMEDGTVIRLRLIEGGYVGYDVVNWIFVRIPGAVFDAVFAACGGNMS